MIFFSTTSFTALKNSIIFPVAVKRIPQDTVLPSPVLLQVPIVVIIMVLVRTDLQFICKENSHWFT